MPVDNPLLRQAATLIVAASDSLHPERADYVCNGVDDQIQIQAAIDEIPDILSGGQIVFLEGYFSISETIQVRARVSFAGMGMNRTVFKIADSAVDTDVDIFNLYRPEAHVNITRFENFKIVGSDAVPTATHNGIVNRNYNEFSLTNFEIGYLNNYGLQLIYEPLLGMNYNYIHNCYFTRCDNGLIVIDDGGGTLNDLIISNSFFERNSIEIKADCEASDILMTGNRFHDAKINIAGGTKIGIHNNIWRIATSHNKLIDFPDRAAPIDVETLITGNLIESSNTPQYSVYIGENVDHVDVFNNVVRGTVSPIGIVAGSNLNGIIKNNPGYNPVGVFATPFDNVNHLVAINGTAAGPTVASQDYEVVTIPCRIISNGGTAVDIIIKDVAGTTIAEPGISCDEWMEPSWKINFGAFTVAPITSVAFK